LNTSHTPYATRLGKDRGVSAFQHCGFIALSVRNTVYLPVLQESARHKLDFRYACIYLSSSRGEAFVILNTILLTYRIPCSCSADIQHKTPEPFWTL